MNHVRRDLIHAMYVVPPGGCGLVSGQVRRDLLISLAQSGNIRLLDRNGDDLGSDFQWHSHDDERVLVSPRDQQMILHAVAKMNAELKDREPEKERLRQQQRKEEEERRKQERSEQRKARLKQTDPHCPYKTLKAAYADGWVDLNSDHYDGERLLLKGHMLVRHATNTEQERKRSEKLYVYKTTLSKVYGLTPRMIEELEPPDDYCVNPHYKSGPPANLFLIERVEAWIDEHEDEVEKARASRAKRSAAGKAVHDSKRAKRFQVAEEWARTVAISISSPLPGTLLADAHKYFAVRGDEDCLTEKGLHAYVRHRKTNYESLLREMYRNEFSSELYAPLRKRVDAVVMAALIDWKQRKPDARHESSCGVDRAGESGNALTVPRNDDDR